MVTLASPASAADPAQDPPRRILVSAGDESEIRTSYVETVDVSHVLVPVVVRDASGRPVTDLSRSEFEILDEGEPQELASFGMEARPVWVILALDTSPSMEPHRLAVQHAALDFVKAQGEKTALALVTFKQGVFLDLDFTRDRGAMEDAIAAVRTGGDSTALLDTLEATARHLENLDGARVAVLFTDGTDTAHPLHEAEERLSSGLEAAQGRDVSTYTVAFGPRAAHGLLRRVSDETGGEALTAATEKDLAAAFAHVAESVGSRYLLTFRPASLGRPGFRSIEVNVSRPGLRVVARRRYLAQ
jgi:VWFA-related protein